MFNESKKTEEEIDLIRENLMKDVDSMIEGEGIASIIDTDLIVDANEPPLDSPDHHLPDPAYQKQRPILLFQLIFIYALIFLKYGTYFTNIKFKGFQIKLFGSLLLTQCIMIHQKTTYELIW